MGGRSIGDAIDVFKLMQLKEVVKIYSEGEKVQNKRQKVSLPDEGCGGALGKGCFTLNTYTLYMCVSKICIYEYMSNLYIREVYTELYMHTHICLFTYLFISHIGLSNSSWLAQLYLFNLLLAPGA
jgi:hypothetical protein